MFAENRAAECGEKLAQDIGRKFTARENRENARPAPRTRIQLHFHSMSQGLACIFMNLHDIRAP